MFFVLILDFVCLFVLWEREREREREVMMCMYVCMYNKKNSPLFFSSLFFLLACLQNCSIQPGMVKKKKKDNTHKRRKKKKGRN